ncbi:MAG: response regulator [Saprospiraceae bacterium]|nr:response regulator [Saprospiraceae bacterium]MCF8250782.1 response regulator [Saprospiraceae bacterium]MCF8281760.1 response regulator [Bacteroidales bacterium]MCF8312583.1 response regulator [Saprospiraceae bacterium]MCF8440912.1 response regulator [Saprospiraceae bacterium]
MPQYQPPGYSKWSPSRLRTLRCFALFCFALFFFGFHMIARLLSNFKKGWHCFQAFAMRDGLAFNVCHSVVLGILLTLNFSCKLENGNGAKTAEGKPNTENAQSEAAGSDSIITGIPIVDQGVRIDFDSIFETTVVPLKGEPKVVSAHPNRNPAGQPVVIPIPKNLTVITPGENGVPLPKKVRAKGKVVPASQPQPILATPLRTKDEAIANIQVLEIEQRAGSDRIETILEDSRGNLWFGTPSGAYKYDGKWLTSFSEQEGLSNSSIRAIVEDRHGNLWFATWGDGVICYDGTSFIHFTEKEGMSSDMVYSMIMDGKGNLWFGTYGGGAVCYDGNDFTIFTDKEGLCDKSALSMMADTNGDIWFGTVKGGACQYDGKSFTHYTYKEGLGSNLIYSIITDRQGAIWFGTYQGASRFDGDSFKNYTTKEGLLGMLVTCIHEDVEGNIWMANRTGSQNSDSGVSRFDGKNFEHYTVREGMSHNIVNSMIPDNAGVIWMGTNAGVTRFDPKSFRHFTEQNGLKFEQRVSSIVGDKSGNIWLGTWVGGLIRFDGENFSYFTKEEGMSVNIINKLFFNNEDELWFDVGSIGFTNFDGKIFEHHLLREKYGRSLLPILQDSRGRKWYSIANGMFCYDSTGCVLFSKKEIFGDKFVSKMLEDSRGQLWFGANDGGVIKYDGSAFTLITEAEGMSNNQLTAILEDSQGYLWFGTRGGGLNRYDGTQFVHFTEAEGLGNNLVNSMLQDGTGNIWVSRQNGVSLIVPKKNWSDSTKGIAPTSLNNAHGDYRIFNYDTKDGLKGKAYSSMYLDVENRLWLGGVKGMSMLDISQFKVVNKPPKVKFDHIEIRQQYLDFSRLTDTAYQSTFSFGKEMSQISCSLVPFSNCPVNMTVPNDLDHLTFYFSGIDWAAPHKIQYSYLMDGVDKGWSLPQSAPQAEYRNLPFGTHTIKVKAVGAAQIWSDPIEYTFTIRPPWLRTWWAYLCYILAGGGILFGIRAYELKRKLAKAEEQRTKEMNEVKSKIYTNITHEFRTPLTIINGIAEKLQRKVDFELREDLEVIKRNGRQLLHLVNQMLDLAKLESGSLPLHLVQGEVVSFLKYLLESFHSLAEDKNIQLKFESELESCVMDHDPVRLQEIVTNLLSNAVKFTPESGKVEMRLAMEKQTADTHFLITVSDTGIGIPADKQQQIFERFYQLDDSPTRQSEGTGIGLTLTQELVKLLKGNIEVESELGKGSKLTVRLPVTNKAKPVDSKVFYTPGISLTTPSPHSDAATKEQPASSDSAKPSLLFIEDSPDLLRYLSSMLQSDFQIITASNGKLGLEKALVEMPDIIISDVMMPEMDGYEVCRRLKENLVTCHIPIILLTAKADAESKIKGLEQGADAYLPKPFDEKELRMQLKRLLEATERLRRYYTSEQFLNRINVQVSWPKEVHNDPLLMEIYKLVNKYITDPELSAEYLASQLNMSYISCFRKVKALTGMGVKEYIQHIRINIAAALLSEHPEWPLSKVATSTGFGSPQFFSRLFKKTMGQTPANYRMLDKNK